MLIKERPLNILLIENNPVHLQEWEDGLVRPAGERSRGRRDHQICTATTPSGAIGAFQLRTDWDAIIIGGDTFDALPVITKIRESFEGVIIAASDSSELRDKMFEHGCTSKATKKDALQQMQQLLRSHVVASC